MTEGQTPLTEPTVRVPISVERQETEGTSTTWASGSGLVWFCSVRGQDPWRGGRLKIFIEP